MNIKEKMTRFKKRWKVVDDATYEENFQKFRTRVITILKDIDDHVRKSDIELFCQYYGIPERWHEYDLAGSYSRNIIDRFEAEGDEIKFYALLEFVFSLDVVVERGYRGYEEEYSKGILLSKIARAIDFSEINLAISVDGEEVIFHPKGEKILDQELVDTVLSFLGQKSGEHFATALREYQKKSAIKSAEALRRSLEEFLRYKLENSKGLDANIAELQKKFKKDTRDPQVRNIIFQTFTYLDQYFNENSKHRDGDIDESENEFLIYQVGLLSRYINRKL